MSFKQKWIGITGNHTINNHEYSEFMQDYTPHGFVDGIQKSNNIPVIIPISEDPSLAEAYIEKLDGFIFTGGQDVNPMLYGKEPSPRLSSIYPLRDAWEQALFQAAVQKGIPILAVCRGFQLINILLGGSVYQDVADYPVSAHHAVQHMQTESRMIFPHHSITVKPDSVLAQVFNQQEKIWVNTWHHQVIEEIAPALTATAWAADGVIEAYESNTKVDYHILGVQWHPEILVQRNNQHIEIFEWFNQF